MKNRDIIYSELVELSQNEFPDIVEDTKAIENKLRFFIVDGSYIDIWISEKRKGIYAYHWERGIVDGTIYRHNNIPDKNASKVKTFPKHFHHKYPERIEESYISDDYKEAIRAFLKYVKQILNESNNLKKNDK